MVNPKELLVVSLTILRSDAGAGSAADENFLFKNIGCGIGDVGASLDDFVSLKAHLARSIANVGNLAVSLDIIASVDGGFELDHVVGAEETFITVLDDEKFGGNVAKKMKHVCTINKISAVMGILCAHANAKHRFYCHIRKV